MSDCPDSEYKDERHALMKMKLEEHERYQLYQCERCGRILIYRWDGGAREYRCIKEFQA